MGIIRAPKGKRRRVKKDPKKVALAQEWEKLCAKWGASPKVSRRRSETQELHTSPQEKRLAQLRDTRDSHAPSLLTAASHVGKSLPVKYTGEMALREDAAQQEIARKKYRVAPLFNKGALQYISDDMDPKTLGRK
jgi:hypothetical protein